MFPPRLKVIFVRIERHGLTLAFCGLLGKQVTDRTILTKKTGDKKTGKENR